MQIWGIYIYNKEYKDGVADLSAWRAQTKNIIKMWGSFSWGYFIGIYDGNIIFTFGTCGVRG
jgi:hypothetical protein